MTMPCQPWTTTDRLCCPDAPASTDCNGDPVAVTYPWTDAELIDVASRVLYHATCERFPGVCPDNELRPCSCACWDASCCKCDVRSVALAGRYPVLQVTEVRVDGDVLPPTAYRLDEFSRLVRIDGGSWPVRQDMTADPDTDEDTFVIRFIVGRDVPADLQYAAALLACELKKACGGQGCELPEGTQRVVRDGIEYDIVSDLPNSIISSDGLTGILEVDRIIYQYRPCPGRSPKRRLMFADDPGGTRG